MRLSLYGLGFLVVAATWWAWFTPIDMAVVAQGIVRPVNGDIRISVEVPGRIVRSNIRDGATVLRGDVLLELDDSDLRLRERFLLHQIDQLEGIMADTSAAYLELEQCRFALSRRSITSPVDGRITTLAPYQPGEWIPAGTPIASLAAASTNRVIEAWVPIADRRQLLPGQAVRLRPDSQHSIGGTVAAIAGAPTATSAGPPLYRVVITTQPVQQFDVGQIVEVRIVVRRVHILYLLLGRGSDDR